MKLPEGLTTNNYVNIYETYLDFVALVPRWKQIKNDPCLKHKFCSRNRNPLFDISSSRYFKTGLGSQKALISEDPVHDHYIQRTKAVELIFNKLEEDPAMGIGLFITFVKKYCSTVSLTMDEHRTITSYCKKNPTIYNYQAYEACGIRVEGLSEIILQS